MRHEFEGWKRGSFAFKPDAGAPAPSPKAQRQSLGGLLLRAMQLEDEAGR
jgi:hypothetical protein